MTPQVYEAPQQLPPGAAIKGLILKLLQQPPGYRQQTPDDRHDVDRLLGHSRSAVEQAARTVRGLHEAFLHEDEPYWYRHRSDLAAADRALRRLEEDYGVALADYHAQHRLYSLLRALAGRQHKSVGGDLHCPNGLGLPALPEIRALADAFRSAANSVIREARRALSVDEIRAAVFELLSSADGQAEHDRDAR